jgi:two-component system sensor histidine kinase KdpD
MKTALLHAVSHDLRTPVTIIKTSASNLSRLGEELAPLERRELAQTIEDEADQLDELIGNLLDMSRLRAGALRLNLAVNSLEEVAGDVAARIFQRTKQERIRLSFPDDLPLLPFDYRLLLQALANLVDNALRYEPPQSMVELRGALESGEARLAIINHGRNLTAEEHQHVMEPFFHGREGHIGLGLAIAKGIIEAHHGRMWAEDTPGGGATFVIALPLRQEGNDGAQGARGG